MRLTPARRRYVYDVLTVVGPVAVFYGLVTDTEVSLWLGVAGTVLQASGIGLARANVPDDDDA